MNNTIDRDYCIRIRRHLHQHPEISGKEYQTAEFIRRELESFGIEYRSVAGTGTFAWLSGRPGDGSVLLRADIDALPIHENTGLSFQSQDPQAMHACGHDIHTAALLGAARCLSQMRDAFRGTVYFAFQQAEEFGHGSQYFIAEGLIQDCKRAFGFHIAPDIPVGTVAFSKGVDAASCDHFQITVHGVASHISKPHMGADALLTAAEIATRIPGLKDRMNPMDNALLGVGSIHAGHTWNIVADRAQIEGTVRATSEESRVSLVQSLETMAHQVAALHGTTVEAEFETHTHALINDEEAYEEGIEAACRVVGKDHVLAGQKLVMGFAGDDFAEYLRCVKGVYAHVGTANGTPESAVPLHSDNLTPDEEAIVIGAGLHVEYALLILSR